MTDQWKPFLIRTGILALVVFAISALSGYVFRAAQQHQILSIEARATDLLAQARMQFATQGDTDIVSRISAAQKLGASAMTMLRETSKTLPISERALLLLANILPIENSVSQPSSTLAIGARRCADDLAWLRDALPPLQLLAGYDAASDIGNAADSHDLTGRFYLARKGLQRALATLANPPADLTTDALVRVLAQTKTLQEQTVPIIRLLDLGDTKNVHLLSQQFIHNAQITAKDAEQVVEHFTDPQLLAALCVSS